MEPGRSTPRTKFFCNRLHWLRSQLEPNNIVVTKIESELQMADIMTKPLRAVKYEANRKLLMGWMAMTLSGKVYGSPCLVLASIEREC